MEHALSGLQQSGGELLGCISPSSPLGPDSWLLEASKEDLISPKGNEVAMSKLCLA